MNKFIFIISLFLISKNIFSQNTWIDSGEQNGEWYGASIYSAGDVNGDGYSDFLIGAPYWDDVETNEGRILLFLGNEAGIDSIPAWQFENNISNSLLGRCVSTAGDVNGDGFSDIIVGAYTYSNGESNEGAVYVFYGSAAGLKNVPDWSFESNQSDAFLGWAVNTAGDINGDGYSDILIGAYLYDDGETNEGKVFLFTGSADGLPDTPSWSFESDQQDAYFGISVSSAGDVNGDGFSDILIGASGYDNESTNEGRAYLFYGSQSGINSSNSQVFESNQDEAKMGYSVSSAGDYNGDGFSDIIIGVFGYSNGETTEGAVFFYKGTSTGVNESSLKVIEINKANAQFGFSVACAGDINGDGYSDLIAGSRYYTNGQNNEGAAFTFLGNQNMDFQYNWSSEGNQINANYGWIVAPAGDVNGDGLSDYAVGSISYDSNGLTNNGQSYLYYGVTSSLSQTPFLQIEGNQANLSLTSKIEPIGDVNGDGFGDILISASGFDNSYTDAGKIMAFYGKENGISDIPDWEVEGDQASESFGSSISSAGDVNGDGYWDIIVGTTGYDNLYSNQGLAKVFLGSENGLSNIPDWTRTGTQSEEWFGSSVSCAGDVNGDGYSDIIVGSVYYDNDQIDEGRAFLFYGSANGIVDSIYWHTESNQTNSWYSLNVIGAGDVNGDGYSDVLVTASRYDNGQTDEGKIFMYYGSANGLSDTISWSYELNQASAAFGFKTAPAGDVNGDGFSDLIVSAILFDNGETNEGKVVVFYGSASGLTTIGWEAEGNSANVWFGRSVSSAGDVNGDGYSDILVGAPYYDNPEIDEGRSYLFLGSNSGLNLTPAWTFESNQTLTYNGWAVNTIGDINGDGYSDIAISTPSYSNDLTKEGLIQFFYGNSTNGRKSAFQIKNTDFSSPISRNNMNETRFGIKYRANHFLGKQKLKLGWEAKMQGEKFSGNNITNSINFSDYQSVFSTPDTSDIFINANIEKSGFQTKVRVRVMFDYSTAITGQVMGPWKYNQSFLRGLYVHNSLPYSCKNFSINEFLIQDASCYNQPDGKIDISITGGTPPYSYLWSNNDTAESISFLNSGMYYLSVYDYISCIVTDSFFVSEPNEITSTYYASICEGDSIFLGSNWQTLPGIYYDTLVASTGCDSVVTLSLTVNPLSHISQYLSICESDSVFIGGNWQSIPGIYYDTLQTINGCDSIIESHLTVNNVNFGDTIVIACDSYTWINGITYTTSTNTPTYTLTNAAGCDSIVTLNLTVNDSNTGDTTAIACDSFEWHGTIYTSSGTVTHTFTNATGCDSVVTLHLTVNQSNSGTDIQTACDDYTWIDGITYTTSTNVPTFTLTNEAGCDSIVTLNLAINNSDTGDTTAIACDSFDWYGTTYTSSGTATHPFANAAGCDSVVTLHLTVNQSNSGTDIQTACDSYTWVDGITYTTSTNTPTFTLTNETGCDSVVTLNLTINSSYNVSQFLAICEGDSYVLGTQTLTSTGTYTEIFSSANGCDSIVTISLTVNPVYNSVINAEICDGIIYTLPDGTDVSVTGTYTNVFTTILGCDSMIITNLLVHPNFNVIEDAQICFGNTYKLPDGTIVNTDGTYTSNLNTIYGCDSIITTNLTVTSQIINNVSALICEGDSYYAGGAWQTNAGAYYDTTMAAFGCDSIIVTNLIVNPVYATTDAAAICEGDIYIFGTQALTIEGDYTETFTSVNGCDSIVTVHLTVNPIVTGDTSAVACENFEWYGSIYTSSGTATHTFTNVAACDSVVTLHLTVNHSNSGTDTQTACDSYTWIDGITYTTSTNTPTVTLTNEAGCDSIVTLNLIINNNNTGDTTAVACDSFEWYGTTYTISGTVTHTFTNMVGCDSIVTLHLTINTSYIETEAATICQGDNYLFGSQTLTMAGTYVETFTSVSGCDSVVSLNLSVNPVYNTTINAEICVGGTYTLPDGTDVTTGGIYTSSYLSEYGCDSIIVTELTVHPVYNISEDVQICNGSSYELPDGTFVNTDGTYTSNLTSEYGCDSIIVTNLTLTSEIINTIDVAICEGDNYYAEGAWQTTTGVYHDTTTAVAGCDSIIVTNLTVNPVYAITDAAAICEGDIYIFGTQTLSVAGDYTETFVSVNGCDSIVTLDLSINPVYNVSDAVPICDGDYYILGAQILTTSGTYSETFTNAFGCDSIVTLDLTVNPVYNTTASAQICNGDTYIFGTQTLTTSGGYTEVFQSVNGCDSAVVLTLNVVNQITNSISAGICEGGSYVFGIQTLTTAGTYTDTLTSSFGCDSIVTLNLTVNPVYNTTASAQICNGNTYVFGTQTLTVAGDYTETFSAINGCDSVVTLTLSVNPLYIISINPSICEGDSVFAGGAWQTTSGNYFDTLQTISGCDSIIEILLTVNSKQYSVINAGICDGDNYILGGQTLTTGGTYTETFTAENGCDSVVTLNLAVNPVNQIYLTLTICPGDSVFYNETWFKEGENYVDSFVTATGCDSIIITNITSEIFDCTLSTIHLCEGDSVLIGENYESTNGIYYENVISALGCTYSCPVQLIINLIQNVNIEQSICTGEIYTFGSQNLTASGNYSQTLVSNTGCDSIINLTLTVNPLPAINLESQYAIYKGDDLNINLDSVQYNYLWSTGQNSPEITLTPDNSFTLFVTVSDNVCMITDSTFIKVSEKDVSSIIIYDVFTPDNDGINDNLYIENIKYFPENLIKIYNRNGMLVYEKEGYKNEDGWDGKYKGSDVPVASYYIVLWPDKNKQDIISKTISILR